MSGRFFRRVLGVFFVTATLLCIPLTATAASPEKEAGYQESWSPISFLLNYFSDLFPDGSEDISGVNPSPKTSDSGGGTSNADEGAGGTTENGGNGENGPGIGPDGSP